MSKVEVKKYIKSLEHGSLDEFRPNALHSVCTSEIANDWGDMWDIY